jgi:hypothetical protein
MGRFSWNVVEALNITEILACLGFPWTYPLDDRRFSLRVKGFGALTQVLILKVSQKVKNRSCLSFPRRRESSLF